MDQQKVSFIFHTYLYFVQPTKSPATKSNDTDKH